MNDTHTDEILTRVEGGIAFVTLNRPKSINSLNHHMIAAMDAALIEWADNDAVNAVVLTGAGTRGLCAGGDVLALYHSARADGAAARRFFFDEYRLNARIASYPKPYVAVMDGIVMGGGVGVAGHGNVRVVTDSSKIAMPEVGIGFIPDVGGTYLLSRVPDRRGLHAALTGAPFSPGDAIAMGFADHYVAQDNIAAFIQGIAINGVETALQTFTQEPPPSQLAAQLEWIETCYAEKTISDIVSALRGSAAGPANAAADLIATRSPIALAVTLAAVRSAARLASLKEVLVQEYRVSCASLRSHDFIEGIRAQLVDKDRTPHWSPSTAASITDDDVALFFAPADPDLTF